MSTLKNQLREGLLLDLEDSFFDEDFEMMELTTQAKFDQLKSEKAIVVFGFDGCGPCRRLKAQLDEQGADYKYVDVIKNRWVRDFMVKSENGGVSIPQVSVNGHLTRGGAKALNYVKAQKALI